MGPVSLDYNAVVTTSVAKQIAESIRLAIIEGRIKVGERLPTEEDLARSYQVSRPTIREALKRLAAQNLVHSRRGPSGGNFVTRPDPVQSAESVTSIATLLVGLGAFDLEEIVAARLETESICVRLAIENRTMADLEVMAHEIEVQSDDSGKVTDEMFCESDVKFHRALVDASGNGPMRFMMNLVVEAMVPITNLISFRERERKVIVRHHRSILDALERRDMDGAIASLKQLMAYLRERYEDATRHSTDVEKTGVA